MPWLPPSIFPTATAHSFRSSARYGSNYSWHAVPIDSFRRDGGVSDTQDGFRSADRQIEHENARVGWAEHQTSAGQNEIFPVSSLWALSTGVALRLLVSTDLWFVPRVPTAPGRPESPKPSVSALRAHHFGTSMDPLRRRLRKLQSTLIIALQLRNETTAIWQNTGENLHRLISSLLLYRCFQYL